MTTSIQQFTINGKKLLVQVDEALPARKSTKRAMTTDSAFENTSAETGPAAKRGAAAKAVDSADIQGTLEAVVGPVEAALKAIKPSEVSVELKLGFKADAGVFLARTSADASVTIKAVWKPGA